MGARAIRVAILNDFALVRESLAAALRSHAAPLHVAYCGASLDEAELVRPDVVLLDLDLQSAGPFPVDRIEVLVAAGIMVILVSDRDRPAGARSALDRGALGVVTKTDSVDVLVEAIRTAAAGELFLPEDLAALLASAPPVPELSPRELMALRLYVSGLKLATVARRMGVSPHTAREYLDRVRCKYEQVGRVARTRTQLYSQALRDGLLGRDEVEAAAVSRSPWSA